MINGAEQPLAPLLTDAITLPEVLTPEWAKTLGSELEKATWRGPKALRQLLPAAVVAQILDKVTVVTKSEPTLVEVNPIGLDATVTVVGDTHGQVHDVLHMLQKAGEPSPTRHYVFNGDFVDRGAWGLEVLLVLAAWKLAFPSQVTLLRGNHETTTCTTMYGFKGELEQKFVKADVRAVYTACKKLFATLPLAACIGSATLVVHGGLFRKPEPAASSRNKRKRYRPMAMNAGCELGTLKDLRAAGKGGLDPNGRGSTVVATDVLWSDPVATQGLQLNSSRGVGVIFGPDVTQRFLEENNLKLVLRSHEGPDARYERDDMASMLNGWTTDHVVDAGRLLTVFSAPDYPQFQSEETCRYGNLAAVAVLKGPSWCEPEMIQYAAVLPRPAATACYDYVDIPGSDEEIEIMGMQISQTSASSADLEDTAAQPATPGPHAESPPATELEHETPVAPDIVSPAFRPPHLGIARLADAEAARLLPAIDGEVSKAGGNGLEMDASGVQQSRRAARAASRERAAQLRENVATNGRWERGGAAASVDVETKASLSAPEAEMQSGSQAGALGQADESAIPMSQSDSQAAPETQPTYKQMEGASKDSPWRPEHPQTSAAIHQVAHAGRELEQAAAHTLALSGGVINTPDPPSGKTASEQNGCGGSPRQGGAAAEAQPEIDGKLHCTGNGSCAKEAAAAAAASPKKNQKGHPVTSGRATKGIPKAPWR